MTKSLVQEKMVSND